LTRGEESGDIAMTKQSVVAKAHQVTRGERSISSSEFGKRTQERMYFQQRCPSFVFGFFHFKLRRMANANSYQQEA
jgi:hypothetical protein